MADACACKPWEQSWHVDHPGRCSTCGAPFVPYSAARECYSAAECEGTCSKHAVSSVSSGAEHSQADT